MQGLLRYVNTTQVRFFFFLSLMATLSYPQQHCSPSILSNLPSLCSSSLCLQCLIWGWRQREENKLWSPSVSQTPSLMHLWNTMFLSVSLTRAVVILPLVTLFTYCLFFPLFSEPRKQSRYCSAYLLTPQDLTASLVHRRLSVKFVKFVNKSMNSLDHVSIKEGLNIAYETKPNKVQIRKKTVHELCNVRLDEALGSFFQ